MTAKKLNVIIVCVTVTNKIFLIPDISPPRYNHWIKVVNNQHGSYTRSQPQGASILSGQTGGYIVTLCSHHVTTFATLLLYIGPLTLGAS